MRAAILSIGDELTTGHTADGNARWLAAQLATRAIATTQIRAVGDDREAIAAALRELAAGVDVLVATGGIGPTADDVTRAALGDVLTPGRDLVTDPRGVAHLRRCFGGREMPPSNLRQAERPQDAELLANRRGTAMGIAGLVGGCRVFVLPGPPGEMRGMFDDQVLPRLGAPGGVVAVTAEVRAFGLGESDAGERLGELATRGCRPSIGITHGGSIVTARIRDSGPAPRVRAEVARVQDEVRRRWAPWAFGDEHDTLASAVGALLAPIHRRLVTAESCTGGALGAMIVDVAGSSGWYGGGWVTYTDALKTSCLGVPPTLLERHGAVSAPVARAMAEGALAAGGADEALAITGVAGPGGGSAPKPVGTVHVALARRDADGGMRPLRFPGDRHTVRDRAAKSALQMLRFAGLGVSAPLLWEVRS